MDAGVAGQHPASVDRDRAAVPVCRTVRNSVQDSKVSDSVVKGQYEQIIAAGGRVAGPAAEAVLTNRLDAETVDWLKTNYLKTELELGHCLRLPQEGPCECDLYLRCTKFFTTSDYIPRLRARLAVEQQLVQDAVERGWAREVERHGTVLDRLRDLLTKLGGLDEQAGGDRDGLWVV